MDKEIKNSINSTTEPKLAEPGAGLSLFEMLILNYIIKRFMMNHLDRAKALRELDEGKKEIADLLEKIEIDDLTKRVLVKRPCFVEDSSRYWSAAMLCNHICKVNGALAKAIESGFTAIDGQDYVSKDRLKAVKPDLEKNQIHEIEVFQQSVERIKMASNKISDQDLKSRLIPHPWFGSLTHLQWIWFAGFHMKIHARQLSKIHSGLTKI